MAILEKNLKVIYYSTTSVMKTKNKNLESQFLKQMLLKKINKTN